MKIMSDAEAFGWKFLSLFMLFLVIVILLHDPSSEVDYSPALIYDTITVTDTVTIHDTVYKWKEPKKTTCDTFDVSFEYPLE